MSHLITLDACGDLLGITSGIKTAGSRRQKRHEMVVNLVDAGWLKGHRRGASVQVDRRQVEKLLHRIDSGELAIAMNGRITRVNAAA